MEYEFPSIYFLLFLIHNGIDIVHMNSRCKYKADIRILISV